MTQTSPTIQMVENGPVPSFDLNLADRFNGKNTPHSVRISETDARVLMIQLAEQLGVLDRIDQAAVNYAQVNAAQASAAYMESAAILRGEA